MSRAHLKPATRDGGLTLLDYSAYWRAPDTFTSNWIDACPAGPVYRRFAQDKCCPYCSIKTIEVFRAYLPNIVSGDYERFVEIWACLSCGWWYDEFTKLDYVLGGERIVRVVTLLREFKIEDASLPLATLARELYTRPKIIHDIHPKKLEVLVAAVLADFFDVEVSVVGRTGDGGIDLVYLDGNIPCAVQVKRRQAAESKEQVSVVREFLGACVLKGFKVGKVVTTASGFTRGANTASREAVQKGILESFELISRERFLDLFRYRRGSYRYPWTASALEWSDLWQKYKRAIIHAEDIFLV